MTAELGECLPPVLRAGAHITNISAGLSGAGVYRVEQGGAAYVLKVARADEPLASWQRRADVQRRAGEANVAPRVVHVDAGRRAVVSELVVDRSLPAQLLNPATRTAAIELVGTTLRRIHDLPPPAGMPESDPRDALVQFWSALDGFALPAFVGTSVRTVLDAPQPPRDRAPVLSHNDANPSNAVYDGARLLMLDWDTAAINGPLFDLATIAMFMRFDDATCAQLLAAHDGKAPAALPPRFVYLRRLVAVLCGSAILRVARGAGHPGSTAGTLDTTLSLGEVYQRMRAGQLDPATPDGQWQFALALVKASV